MERIEQYSVRMLDGANETTEFATAAWSAGKWVLAIFAAVAFAFGVFAAEVELAKSEQITEPYPR